MIRVIKYGKSNLVIATDIFNATSSWLIYWFNSLDQVKNYFLFKQQQHGPFSGVMLNLN